MNKMIFNETAMSMRCKSTNFGGNTEKLMYATARIKNSEPRKWKLMKVNSKKQRMAISNYLIEIVFTK
jgi:hypothetical protein